MHAAGMDGTAGDWTGQEWKGQAWTTSVVLGTPQCYRGELQIVPVFANRKKRLRQTAMRRCVTHTRTQSTWCICIRPRYV